MSNKILRVIFWVLSFAVMVALFYSSGRSIEESREDSARFMEFVGAVDSKDEAMDTTNSPLFQLHIAIRKQAHFIAYSALGALLFLSLYGYRGKSLTAAVIAWAGATLYGITDEIHQTFTARGASVSDVLLNSKSAVIGVLILWIIFLIIESSPKLYNGVNKVYDINPHVKVKYKNEHKEQAV